MRTVNKQDRCVLFSANTKPIIYNVITGAQRCYQPVTYELNRGQPMRCEPDIYREDIAGLNLTREQEDEL